MGEQMALEPLCAAMRAEHHFRDGDNRKGETLPKAGCERRDGAGVVSPKHFYRGIGTEQVPARRVGRGSDGGCGGLAKSSSTRPITSVNRSAGQPLFTASAMIDSGTQASKYSSGGV